RSSSSSSSAYRRAYGPRGWLWPFSQRLKVARATPTAWASSSELIRAFRRICRARPEASSFRARLIMISWSLFIGPALGSFLVTRRPGSVRFALGFVAFTAHTVRQAGRRRHTGRLRFDDEAAGQIRAICVHMQKAPPPRPAVRVGRGHGDFPPGRFPGQTSPSLLAIGDAPRFVAAFTTSAFSTA